MNKQLISIPGLFLVSALAFAADSSKLVLDATFSKDIAPIFEVILPKDNEKDLAEVPENLRNAMKMHFVETMDQVLAIALEGPLPQMAEEAVPQAIAPIAPPTEGPAAHQ